MFRVAIINTTSIFAILVSDCAVPIHSNPACHIQPPKVKLTSHHIATNHFSFQDIDFFFLDIDFFVNFVCCVQQTKMFFSLKKNNHWQKKKKCKELFFLS